MPLAANLSRKCLSGYTTGDRTNFTAEIPFWKESIPWFGLSKTDGRRWDLTVFSSCPKRRSIQHAKRRGSPLPYSSLIPKKINHDGVGPCGWLLLFLYSSKNFILFWLFSYNSHLKKRSEPPCCPISLCPSSSVFQDYVQSSSWHSP